MASTSTINTTLHIATIDGKQTAEQAESVSCEVVLFATEPTESRAEVTVARSQRGDFRPIEEKYRKIRRNALYLGRGNCSECILVLCAHVPGFFLRIPTFLHSCIKYLHSWAQRKLSPLSPLNILLMINGPLLS